MRREISLLVDFPWRGIHEKPNGGAKYMYSINTKLDGVSVFIAEDRKGKETILFSELFIQEDCISTIKRLERTYNVPLKAFRECFSKGISLYRDNRERKMFLSNAKAYRKAVFSDFITHLKPTWKPISMPSASTSTTTGHKALS